MRVAVITSSGASHPAAGRRADAMARFLAARGDWVVRLPTDTDRLKVRHRIVPIHLPIPQRVADSPLARLTHIPRHLPWALKVAGHLRLNGPFDAVLAADAGLSLVAASIFRSRQGTPFAVSLEGAPPSWTLPLLKRADAVLIPSEGDREAAVAAGIPDPCLHVCPTPVDPGLGDLRPRRAQARGELGLSRDSFVTLCPDLEAEGAAEAAVREAARELAHHGMFRFLLPAGLAASRGTRPLPDGLDPLDAFAAADAVYLSPEPEAGAIPTSLIEALATGRPVLLAADEADPAAALLVEAGAGSVLPPHDAAPLRVGAFALWADRRLADRLGLQGQRWVEAHRSVQKSGEVLAEVLDGLSHARSGG